jgi:hypothetical protein
MVVVRIEMGFLLCGVTRGPRHRRRGSLVEWQVVRYPVVVGHCALAHERAPPLAGLGAANVAANLLLGSRHGLGGDDVEAAQTPVRTSVFGTGVAVRVDRAAVEARGEDRPGVGDIDSVDVQASQILVPCGAIERENADRTAYSRTTALNHGPFSA